MASITKPISIQIKAVNAQYDKTVQYLTIGDPGAKDQIDILVNEANKLAAIIKQTWSQLMSDADSVSNSISSVEATSKEAVNKAQYVIPGVGTAVYVAGSADAAITTSIKTSSQLATKSATFLKDELTNIATIAKEAIKLFENILSLQPIIATILGTMENLKKTIAEDLIKLEKAKRLMNEKIQKNIEWTLESIVILQDEQIAEFRYNRYSQILPNITDQGTKERLQRSMLDQLEVMSVLIPARKKDLENDKKQWIKKWEKDEAALAEEL